MKDARFRKMPAHGIIHLRNLWASVILQALHDTMLPPFTPRVFADGAGMRQAIYRDTWARLISSRAHAWFASRYGADEPGSFTWICDLLGLDADAVRKRVKEQDRG